LVEYIASTSFNQHTFEVVNSHINALSFMTMTAAFALFSIMIFLTKYNTESIKIKNKGLDRL